MAQKDTQGEKQNQQDVKARLMEVATALFAKKGYAVTSVREIVAGAGVTKPVLYYYFGSKEGLFRAILDRAGEQQEELLDKILRMPGTTLERLVELSRSLYQGVMENQELFHMIHNLVFGPPQGLPGYDFEIFQRRMEHSIMKIYREGLQKENLEPADPEEVAVMVMGLIDFCFHLDQVRPKRSDPERPGRLLELAFKGLASKEVGR